MKILGVPESLACHLATSSGRDSRQRYKCTLNFLREFNSYCFNGGSRFMSSALRTVIYLYCAVAADNVCAMSVLYRCVYVYAMSF